MTLTKGRPTMTMWITLIVGAVWGAVGAILIGGLVHSGAVSSKESPEGVRRELLARVPKEPQ